jgi:hypothetical protein
MDRDSPNPLWHALYVPEERKVQVSFYLGDEFDPDHPDRTRIIRSEYMSFAIENGNGKKIRAER